MTRSLAIESETKSAPGDDRDSDRALLDRFLNDRDEAAFEILVLRYGPTVLRVCRRWLGDGQDAEDACQATFLVLVNRAGDIQQSGYIVGWLCGVARRVAGRAKMRADRRRSREGTAMDLGEIPDRERREADDLHPILRDEVNRLPEKYRRPIELCYWEGLSSDQAAERLRCPTGTLKWRLSRAREILHGRLERLGLAIAVLLMWRLPRLKADDSRLSRNTRKMRLPRSGGADSRPSRASFVRDTVAMAVFVRDCPQAFLGDARTPSAKGRKRGGFPRILAIIAFFGVIIALYLAIPAIANPRAHAPAAPCGPETLKHCH